MQLVLRCDINRKPEQINRTKDTNIARVIARRNCKDAFTFFY